MQSQDLLIIAAVLGGVGLYVYYNKKEEKAVETLLPTGTVINKDTIVPPSVKETVAPEQVKEYNPFAYNLPKVEKRNSNNEKKL